MHVGVIGGGAAGFFYAVNVAQNYPQAEVTIYEQSKTVLNKVRISGGGRCNVTHGCYDPKELVQYYPRGAKELIGPFHKFACGDMIAWFDERGVELKVEEDGRVFPTSDDSETIINCFQNQCRQLGVKINTKTKIKDIVLRDDEKWKLIFEGGASICDKVMFAPGSSAYWWQKLSQLGHTIIDAVPSLFTFNTKATLFRGLAGVSQEQVVVSIPALNLTNNGPLLVTHWGLSGPAILKLSAEGARGLNALDYNFDIIIDWLPSLTKDTIAGFKKENGKKLVNKRPDINIPSRLWNNLTTHVIKEPKRWADLNKKELEGIINVLKQCKVSIRGKSTFKEEFVTAGGVDLKEVDFKDFSSKILPNVHFAGEVLNIDGVTGGFNFQAAWTGAYLAAQ